MTGTTQTTTFPGFQFPAFLWELILKRNAYYPLAIEQDDNPFVPLRELSRIQTPEGREFWNEIREKYVEADRCGSVYDIEDWEILIIFSKHNVPV